MNGKHNDGCSILVLTLLALIGIGAIIGMWLFEGLE